MTTPTLALARSWQWRSALSWPFAGTRAKARSLGFTTAALIVVLIGFHLYDGGTELTNWWASNTALALLPALCGLAITVTRPQNLVGWLVALVGLAEAACGAGREIGVWAILHGVQGGTWVFSACDSLWIATYALFPLGLMFFPDGHLVTARWRPFVGMVGLSVACMWTASTFDPGTADVRGHIVANPLGGALPGVVVRTAISSSLWLTCAVMAVAIASISVRYHRSAPAQRLQLRWLVVAGVAVCIEMASELLPFNGWDIVTGPVAVGLFTGAITVAIVRHRLWDIDLIINRAVVFLTSSACLAACYLGVVAILGRTIARPSDLGASLVAAGVVAVLFAPLRQRLQRLVDTAVYGNRNDPYRALADLGERIGSVIRPGAELTVLAKTVAQSLKLAYTRIDDAQGRPLATFGVLRGEATAFPLVFQGKAMGALMAGPPSGHRSVGPTQRRLLADLACQMGPAVHAVQLSTDLQASRQRLVNAKEEERRRLRRDLHDGLGPKLAAIRLRLDSTAGVLDNHPQAARAALDEITGYLKETIDDVRNLVYGLRPPALDELGLRSALIERARQLEDQAPLPCRITVTSEGTLDDLPAAVEVAVYWIVTEALTNVVRHSGARGASVHVSRSDNVEISVDDDGGGLASGHRPGVGSSSMAERAAELGGTCSMGTSPSGGVRVLACIPLPIAPVTTPSS